MLSFEKQVSYTLKHSKNSSILSFVNFMFINFSRDTLRYFRHSVFPLFKSKSIQFEWTKLNLDLICVSSFHSSI